MSNDLIMSALPQKSRIHTSSITLNEHVVKIWGDISEPEDWAEEINLIENASEDETIVLDLCTPGGYGVTAALFNRALRTSQALTIGRIGPDCSSAGSLIALSCKSWEVDETSELMIHTSAYGISGKDVDILEHANFSRKQMYRLFSSVYSGFLTEDELSDVIKGTPLYFNSEEIVVRLNNLAEYRKANQEDCNDPDCNTCCSNEEGIQAEATLGEFDFDDMIASAVEKGVDKAMAKVYKKYDLVAKTPVKKTKPPSPDLSLFNEVVVEVLK
jgi:ATP-dependent protease ClpP protease subunit